jgi:hypothetical protein
MLNSRRHPEPIKNIDCVLLGAFERHNFGDLLMGYIFETLLGRNGIRVVSRRDLMAASKSHSPAGSMATTLSAPFIDLSS